MQKNPFLENFKPYIPAEVSIRELTPFPLLVGTLLGIIFGASSLYLVLKVGMTVSASIPVAVIAITLFKLLSKIGFRDATILEANIMQTAGSAGESIAFGVGVTMPAIMILGFDLEIWRATLVAVLGGLLGILMMIPLRRALIRDQHGYLKYPEGTACAEVLKAGASEESRRFSSETSASTDSALQGGKIITIGFLIGVAFNTLMKVFNLWKPTPERDLGNILKGGKLEIDNDPTLLGVGYIIGPRIAGLMIGGGILSYLVLIPLIKFFGESAARPIAPELSKTVAEMSASEIRSAYILYIGAGAVAMAGIISLVRSAPIIWHGIRAGLSDLRASSQQSNSTLPRTDRDIPMKWVVVGIIILIAAIMLSPRLGLYVFADPLVSFLGALLIVALGFLFVTVSSRLTGEIGSSSNPISGMTVATLLITCLIFLALGWTNPDPYFVTALSIGGIVCIAASNGGTTSQDLKTGFWVGGTPWRQQVAILIGALSSALILGSLLIFLNDSRTYYKKLDPNSIEAQIVVTEDKLAREGGEFRSEKPGGKHALTDTETYRVWHNTDPSIGQVGKYLVGKNGHPVYFVDPGINGVLKEDEEGNKLERYDAPKATLMSYIIKGILSRELPWGLVIIGAMIAIVLELSGIGALAFAVGLYLPLSTSAPVFVGGIVRWAVDFYLKKKLAKRNLTQEQIIAETDKSNGVLLASGYIAGGAIAGILIALFAVVETLKNIQESTLKWSQAHNPFFEGPNSDWLALIPLWILALFLYYVGREMILSGKKNSA
ncbi:MAG: oligopeptide transporter, OPT family [Acidobacteria bacterium]|jgi:putative OPT family oligopeptide transporter|nr:MAG: oligopeptide transporter, OPT family [Acidobacteriota bacterium]GIU81307.1 MAG: oligopeptide transporter, OPT family [Pyrinomonadaceae bacterium]